jgi:simple sugar transport system substrate-binding protein
VLKAAWVYEGPVADAGGTFAHDRGRRAVEASLGKRVETSFVENAARAGAAGPAIRDLAARGHQIIFATGTSFMAVVHELAAEFPDVKFELIGGQRTTDNLRPCHARSFEGAYLAGLMAGGVTQSGLIGFVGSHPMPAVLRDLNAFALGAQVLSPEARTRVAWVGTSFSPQKEREAAQQLMDAGADVLLQSTDSTAVIQAAESRGKHAFGWQSDMSPFAPRAHLASWVMDWGPHYIKACEDVISGQWTARPVVLGMKEGGAALVKLSDLVSPELRKRLDTVGAGLKVASAAVFTGPVLDNAGRTTSTSRASTEEFRRAARAREPLRLYRGGERAPFTKS